MLKRPQPPPSPTHRERHRRQRRLQQQRHRQRAREGRAVYPVEIGDEVLTMLISFNWLAECDQHDRAAVGRAIAAMLSDAAKEAQ